MSENMYGNFVTQQESAEWSEGPVSAKTEVGIACLSRADQIAFRKKEGWRKIRNRLSPTTGCRATKTLIVDNKDGETCDVNILSQINIADEQAAKEVEAAKWEEDSKKVQVSSLCDSQETQLFVALHNTYLGKPITEENVLIVAQKIVGL